MCVCVAVRREHNGRGTIAVAGARYCILFVFHLFVDLLFCMFTIRCSDAFVLFCCACVFVCLYRDESTRAHSHHAPNSFK